MVFTAVDLRWGITDEQVAEGQVLPICLAEIDGARPFFVGLIGERYGWVPAPAGEELTGRYPWLAENAGMSVTEIECVHGALADPARAASAYFYLRDPVASARLGEAGTPEDDTAARKLGELKGRIRGSGLGVREGFETPEELERLVTADLSAEIDRLFPADEVPDPLEREAMIHGAFGYELASAFAPRPGLTARLDRSVADGTGALLVTGPSGNGKSALLASWVRAHTQLDGRAPAVVHFCGASAASSDWRALCHRVSAEVGRATGVTAEMPARAEQLAGAFKDHLTRAAAARRFVLVLDGVDQLEDREGALELAFLPERGASGLTVIASAASGSRPAEEARRRGWAEMVVTPLEDAERATVLQSLLSRYSKSLGGELLDRACSARAAGSPLYLSVLADELAIIGSHDTLDSTIARYADAAGAGDIYSRVLDRWERDYGSRPGLVGDALRAIWAARRGLTETELADVLGDDSPLPQALLAPLLLAAGRQLTSRSGLVGFSHALLREAVEARYLPDETSRKAARLDLAAYFMRDRLSVRSVDELPWLLQQAAAWERLAALLADLEFLGRAWSASPQEIRRYWATIESASPLRMAEVYRGVSAASEGGPGASALAILLGESGHYDDAAELLDRSIETRRGAGDAIGLADSLGNRANVARARGDLDGAMALLEEQERLCRETGDMTGLQTCFGNQALVLRTRGKLAEALRLLAEQERICRDIGDDAGLRLSLGNRGLVLTDLRDFDGALSALAEQERLCRECADLAGLAMALGAQGAVLRARGDAARALELHREEERSRRELGDREGVQASLGQQALILRDQGDVDAALALLEEQERICREIGFDSGLAAPLGYRALILNARGDSDGALALLAEAERISRDVGDAKGVGASLIHRARILIDRRDGAGGLKLLEEAERVLRETDDKAVLAECLGRQASVMRDRGDIDRATTLVEEQEWLCREVGHLPGLASALGGRALALKARGEMDAALALHAEEERICREIDDPGALAASLCNQGVIHSGRGDWSRALELHREEVQLSRRTGDAADLQRALGNQGCATDKLGDPDGAMALYAEQERICRQTGNLEGLAVCLGNQANIVGARGDLRGALRLADEGYAIATKYGFAPVAEWLGANIERARGRRPRGRRR